MIRLFQNLFRTRVGRVPFVRFVFVAILISVIDACGLYLLMALGVDAYLSRLVSYTAAMTAGYILNRYFTFHHIETGRALWHSLLRHYSVHSTGGVLNFGIYTLVLIAGRRFDIEPSATSVLPLLGLWLGGLSGLCFNFFFSKKLVFDS